MIIRTATESDAPVMGRVMVDTYMRAHKGQMPDEAWQKRKQEWTYDVSEKAFARDIRAIADGSEPESCIYVAAAAVEDERDEIIGLVVGGRAGAGLWPDTADIDALYVRSDYQQRGVGRRLLQTAVRHLMNLGMKSLMILCLAANGPANKFYASLGGRIMGTTEFDEESFLLPENIYGWEDISTFPMN